MFNFTKHYFSANRKLIFNFFYIGVMKFLNIGSKYILIGYLIRALGENSYGLLAWIDSIVQYFILVINFGFDLYVAKHIVENKNDRKKLNEVISTVYYIKGILFVVCVFLLIPISFNTQIYESLPLILMMLLLGIGEVLAPIWFFQGIEKMKPITIITFFSKVILVLLTFIFVKQSTDISLYILFLVLSTTLWGFYGFLMMRKEVNFKFIPVSRAMIVEYLKEGNLFFIGKFSTYLFNLGVIFMIGYMFSKAHVAGFDIAMKIIFAFIIPFEVLQQALFPKVVIGMKKKTLRLIALGTLLLSVLGTFFLYIFSYEVISCFGGNEMLKYSSVFNMLLILTPFICLTIIIGNCYMVANGLNKEYNFSLIISAIIFTLLVGSMYMTGNMSFTNLLLARILTEIILFMIRSYYVFKNKII